MKMEERALNADALESIALSLYTHIIVVADRKKHTKAAEKNQKERERQVSAFVIVRSYLSEFSPRDSVGHELLNESQTRVSRSFPYCLRCRRPCNGQSASLSFPRIYHLRRHGRFIYGASSKNNRKRWYANGLCLKRAIATEQSIPTVERIIYLSVEKIIVLLLVVLLRINFLFSLRTLFFFSSFFSFVLLSSSGVCINKNFFRDDLLGNVVIKRGRVEWVNRRQILQTRRHPDATRGSPFIFYFRRHISSFCCRRPCRRL